MLTLYSPPSPITAIVIWCCSTQQPQSGYGVLAVQPSPTPPTGTAGGSHHVLSQRSEPPFPALWLPSHSSPDSTRCTGRKTAAVRHGETSLCAEGLKLARRACDGMAELSYEGREGMRPEIHV